MIRIVMLGTGGSVPSVERGLSAVALRHEGGVYLFDCGEGTQRQMMRYKISYSKAKCIFITHLHADHVLGLPGMCETLKFAERREPLYIFGPPGTEEFCSRIDASFIVARDIDSSFIYRGNGFIVRAFDTRHSRGSLGYVFEEDARRNFDEKKARKLGISGKMFGELERNGSIAVGKKTITYESVSKPKKGRKIAYTGDTMACREVEDAAEHADLLIHDGTFGEEMRGEAAEKFHSTVADAAASAKKAGVKKLILTHISTRYKKNEELEKQAKAVFKNSQVAFDGMELCV
ncbi:MAG: ribonuclease Z [Candidatus Micrarchaeota archaeon]|nr:ribonuclease Z [Candidatus Micrarchaeota archaeon]